MERSKNELLTGFAQKIVDIARVRESGAISQEMADLVTENYIHAIELEEDALSNEKKKQEYRETVELMRKIREGILVGLQIGANVAAGRYDSAVTQAVALLMTYIN